MAQHWEHHVYWWEHQRESWDGLRGSPGIRAMLRAMGAEGWELVTVTETAQTGYTFFFKRPGETSPPERVNVHADGAPEVRVVHEQKGEVGSL